jgi:hypothetical protein
MKSRSMLLLAVGVLTATLLSGCVIVPYGGWWYGDGGYYRGHGGGRGYYYASPYRPYYHPGR